MQSFALKFSGVMISQGQLFSFPIDSFMGCTACSAHAVPTMALTGAEYVRSSSSRMLEVSAVTDFR